MNLQQLRSVHEVIKHGMSVTRAAEQLHTSQPVVTRHIQSLEKDLGVDLFVRRRKRLARLTGAGAALLPLIEQTLRSVEGLRHTASAFGEDAVQDVTIATVHTHGRAILPPAVQKMTQRFPKSRVRLLHGHRRQVAEWVSTGEAELSVAPMPREPFPDLLFVPCHEVHVVVLCPDGHPLLRRGRLSLADIAEHPIITYDESFSSRAEIDRPFLENNITTNVALTTTHADVIKQYVRAGFGVGLVAHTVYDEAQDSDLRMIDARHLFTPNVVHLGTRRGAELSRCTQYLIESLSPKYFQN